MTALHDSTAMRLTLDGELDHARSDDFDRVVAAFADSGHPSVDLDVCAVDFVDSLGLSMLVRLHAIADARGGRVLLVGPSHQFQRVLRLSGIDRLVAVTD